MRAGLVTALICATALASATSGTTAPSLIVDRTVVCATGNGNPREIDVSAKSGLRVREDRSKWQDRPYARFIAGATSIVGKGNAVSASIIAGWPPAKYAGFPVSTKSLSISARCQPSRTRVPLSTAGLSGVVATQFGDEYDCVVPAKVLVRVRSVLRAPTSVRRVRERYGGGTYEDEFVASGPVRDAVLVIRAPSGKTIALATVHESGRARSFLSDTCGPNG